VSDAPDRRNPLRLIVTKETQLRILWLVGGGVFFSLGAMAWVSFWVHERIWLAALGLVIGAFASLWVSRQIAGPFYRIEKDLEAMLSGAKDGQPIHLRPGDPLQHLADLINQLTARDRR
jgi:hypothetical protein